MSTMQEADITPLILAFNEAPNLGRTLEQLSWASGILIVDSFSTDETLEIAKGFPNVRVIERRFDDHTAQWNHGLDQVRTNWVLALDADYVLTPKLIDELQSFRPLECVSAYFVRFKYCVYGRPLRGSLYPPRAVLFQRSRCRYVQDGHTQVLRIDGSTETLQSFIHHDDRKPLERWLWAQSRYATLEVEKLLRSVTGEISFPDRVRRTMVFGPVLVFFYTLFAKGLIFEGWPGWFYVLQRTYVEILLSLRLLEEKLKAPKDEG